MIALQASSGLVLNAKKMYIKATSHCLIRYQSIVGELCTIKSEDKFTQSEADALLDILIHLCNDRGMEIMKKYMIPNYVTCCLVTITLIE